MSKRMGVLIGLLLGATLLYASSTPISGTENHMFVAQVNGGTNITVESAMFQPDRSEVQPESEACNALSEGAIYMNTTSHTLRFCNASVWGDIGSFGASSGTLNTVAKFTPNGTTLGNSTITDDGTVVTVNTATTMRAAALSDGTAGFLNVTGTLPAVISAQVIAANALITSAGSSAFSQIALAGSLLAGYTGTSKTNAVSAFNTAAGTGTTTSGGIANYGVYSTTEAVGAGWNVGVGGYASNSTVRNVGGYFQASNSAATDAIGVHGRAQTATNNVGVLASTGSGIPSISGIYTAFLADNTDAAQPIAIFRDNGAALPATGATNTWNILDGAIPQYGLGVLTNATMAASTQAYQTQSTSSYTWTNAQVAALSGTAGDITVATLPAKTQVLDAAVVILTAAAGPATVTVSCGDANGGTPFVNYIIASDAKAAVNTFYGDALGERGTSLDVEHYYLPSYTATTLVTCHFISTGANLSTVTTSTGRVILTTRLLP